MNSHRKLIRWLWFATLAAVIVGELSPSSSSLMKTVASAHVPDKVLHFSAYLVLALLPGLTESRFARLAATGVGVMAMGVILEFLQKLVPGRAFELLDMVANNLGVLCGMLLSLVPRLVSKPGA